MENFNSSGALTVAQRLEKQKKRAQIKFKESFYCFNMTLSFILMVILYTFKICFSAVFIIILMTTRQNFVKIATAQDTLDDIISRHLYYYNVIHEYAAYGKDMRARNTTVQELMPALIEEINKDSDFENFFDVQSELSSINTDYGAYIAEISNTNLCTTMDALKFRKELCEKLDSTISKKGILQVFHHNQDYMLNILMKIVASDYTLSPQDAIGGENFREWEYAFDTIYIPSYFEIYNKTGLSLNQYGDNTEEGVLFSRALVTILIIMMVICYYIVYKRLSDSSKRVAYCY